MLQISELGEEIKGFGEGVERQRKDQYHLITPQLWHLFTISFSILFFPHLEIQPLKLQPCWKDSLISYISFSCVYKKQSWHLLEPPCQHVTLIILITSLDTAEMLFCAARPQ